MEGGLRAALFFVRRKGGGAAAILILGGLPSNARTTLPAATADRPVGAGVAEAQAPVDGGRFEEAIVALRPLPGQEAADASALCLCGLASLEASRRPGREHAGGDFDRTWLSLLVRVDGAAGRGRERTESERWRHRRLRARAGVAVALSCGFTVGGGELRWSDCEGNRAPFVPAGGAREDRTRSLRASVHERRDSNARLYEYRRTGGELRFVRRF